MSYVNFHHIQLLFSYKYVSSWPKSRIISQDVFGFLKVAFNALGALKFLRYIRVPIGFYRCI